MNNSNEEKAAAPDVKVGVVLFATPTFTHSLSPEYVRSFMEASWLLKEAGIEHGIHLLGGDCFVASARNRCVTAFLELPQATDLFFLDDDVGFDPKAILRLLLDPQEVIAGIYPKKLDRPDYPVTLELGEDGRFIQQGRLYRALGIPGGFLRIKRSAIEKMIQEYPTQYEWPEIDGSYKTHYSLFESGIHHGMVGPRGNIEFWGEDFWFCQKWRQMGGEIWIDPNIAFSHSGRKKFVGNFNDTLQVYLQSQEGGNQ